jgi:hypothetical protein
VAGQLSGHRFDLKWFIRELVNSETYQLGGTGSSGEAAPRWFERARVRPLAAEELLAAMRTATRYDATGLKIGGDTHEYFQRYFGEPTNGQGDFQASLMEHLFLNHSDQVRRLVLASKGSLAEQLVTSKDPWDKRVDRLFLSVLSRLPRPAERQRFVPYLTADAKKPQPLVEDAVWVLLNCAEFRFNH